MEKGFILHALADAYAHTWETRDIDNTQRGGPRYGPWYTTGYPEFLGHLFHGTLPDLIRRRPERYRTFLYDMQDVIKPGQARSVLDPLVSQIMDGSITGTIAQARAYQLSLTKDNEKTAYNPERVKPHSLYNPDQSESYPMPTEADIKNIIEKIKCHCAR